MHKILILSGFALAIALGGTYCFFHFRIIPDHKYEVANKDDLLKFMSDPKQDGYNLGIIFEKLSLTDKLFVIYSRLTTAKNDSEKISAIHLVTTSGRQDPGIANKIAEIARDSNDENLGIEVLGAFCSSQRALPIDLIEKYSLHGDARAVWEDFRMMILSVDDRRFGQYETIIRNMFAAQSENNLRNFKSFNDTSIQLSVGNVDCAKKLLAVVSSASAVAKIGVPENLLGRCYLKKVPVYEYDESLK